MKITTKYGSYENCSVSLLKYRNGHPAIKINQGFHPIMTASVCLIDTPLPEGHIFIKNWAENEGILEELIRLKIIKDTGKTSPCGFVEANLCKLLITQSQEA